MIKTMRLNLLFCFFLLMISGLTAQNQKLVILKLDDVIEGSNGDVISSRWQRVADYIEKKKIKAAFGIIGHSLKEDNPDYFKWITDREERGWIEFWNHGYWERTEKDTVGEFEGNHDQQLRALQLTDSLAKTKLGLILSTWGPHWSDTNIDTDKALAQMSQIRMIFGNPAKPAYYKGYVFPNNLNMEFPVHNPNFEEFVKAYTGKWKSLEFFYLQGHPDSWSDERWDNFVKIVEFLETKNVRFVTPSEFMEIMKL